jgi:DNA-binding IclR family transcriptional regulator
MLQTSSASSAVRQSRLNRHPEDSGMNCRLSLPICADHGHIAAVLSLAVDETRYPDAVWLLTKLRAFGASSMCICTMSKRSKR